MNIAQYTDKYFTRTKQILEAEQWNPIVRAQVFVRNGPGIVAGVDEAVDLILENTPIRKNGGKIRALRDGSSYSPKETLMTIEAPIQDIVELETIYLGIIAAEITKANGGSDVNYQAIQGRMQQITALAGNRPVLYFGARHWHYNQDAQIAAAAFRGGAAGASTDAGAAQVNQKGQGTIPHVLENVAAAIFGKDRAVVESTKAFDRNIDPAVPRIALVDYNNREIDDSIATADALQGRLYGVRVDTCGENMAQGAECGPELVKQFQPPESFQKYWQGTGVTVAGVYALRQALDRANYEEVKMILTSGFGNPEKVEAFLDAEQRLEQRLFDGLGVGGIYEARAATMDVVAIGDSYETLQPMAKVGRYEMRNQRLEEIV